MKKKVISVLLAAAMTLGLITGCGSATSDADGGNSTKKEEVKIRTGETISPDSKWIDSDIEGAIDESTKINLEDDFYTYCNRDWLLENKPDTLYEMTGRTMSSSDRIVNERLLKIFNGDEDPEAEGNVEVPKEYVSHDQDLVTTFAKAAGDWDTRNKEGVEPLKKYLDYIDDIDSVEDLKAYLLDEDSKNLFNIGLVSLNVTVMEMDTQNYYLLIGNDPGLTLDSASSYVGGGFLSTAMLNMKLEQMKEKYGYILERLGYSDREINNILKKCYKFECSLVDHKGDDTFYNTDWPYLDESLETTSKDDIKSMEGNFPLAELIDTYGYDTDKTVIVNPSYIKYLGRTIKESNLDDIKAYLLIHTVKDSGMLLDKECLNKVTELDKKAAEANDANDLSKQIGGDAGGKSGDKKEQQISTDDAVLINLVTKYLSGPMDTVYISRYLKSEEKADLQELTGKIVDYYHEMLNSEEWLSDKTIEYANKKLDSMTRNILYPDTFTSYDYLDISGDAQLLDMVADINEQKRGANAYLLESEVDHSAWDLADTPTTENNCYYMREYNSINILAGYTAGDTYDIDMPMEEKLGKIGAVIGHEITHGFDNNGAKYDKDGNYADWWELNDKLQFMGKTASLQTYYSSITPYPGAENLNGVTVSGEAIADMGGMKCMLGIAKDIEDFDYDLFFKSYEALWGEIATYEYETQVVKDVHPLNYLRGNVTVMQFDEFYDTYDIKPGDGMYMAPDDRIAVW